MRKRLRKKLAARPARCASCEARAHEHERLRQENATLREQNRRLRQALDEARRSGKRQAAPFSKGPPKDHPQRPGRKPGEGYGPRARRPPPVRVDEVLDAPLPDRCPDCGGPLEDTETQDQFQADLPPVQPRITQFRVHVGHCRRCGTRVQGRHPRQTSNALGAAASQVGPRAVALAADLNKGLGLSFGKVSRLLGDAFGLSLTPGGICLATARVARIAEPTYHALAAWIRRAPVVSPDETGWKIGGHRAWLWAFVSEQHTVYAIRRGRGFAEAAEILGEEFPGVLARDGWGPYRSFVHAWHQTCLAHLLRRCRELLEVAERGAARVPWAVHRILKRALELRDRRDAGTLSPRGLAVLQGKLEAVLDRLLAWRPRHAENRKLLQHLRTERDALFTFLGRPSVPATNWWAERAIRPAVVTRKSCGGNRTWAGAHVQEILASVLRTARQQGRDPLGILVELLRSPEPAVATVLARPRRVLLSGRPTAPS